MKKCLRLIMGLGSLLAKGWNGIRISSLPLIMGLFIGSLLGLAILINYLCFSTMRYYPSLYPVGAPTPDLSEIVEDELRKLAPGKILFNPPQEMTVGVRERIEVRIAKTITEDLTKGLKGRGALQIEEIKVGTFMKVHLTGDNFDIKSLSSEEQLVAGEGFTQWDWNVTPLKSGIQTLSLIVTVRIKLPNHDEEKIDYPVFDRQIKVKVNIPYTIKNFLYSYWEWIVSTIGGSGIIGLIVRKWFKKKKKSRKAR